MSLFYVQFSVSQMTPILQSGSQTALHFATTSRIHQPSSSTEELQSFSETVWLKVDTTYYMKLRKYSIYVTNLK